MTRNPPLHRAYVMLREGRPRLGDQRAAARAYGIDVDLNEGSIFVDDVREKRTTNPDKLLEQRTIILNHLRPGHIVFVRSPLCLGISATDARSFVDRIHAAQCLLYVSTENALYRSGDEIADLIGQFTRDYNAHAMRRMRAKKLKSK
jgi:hypothetical protein